jgi:hypothetical protein
MDKREMELSNNNNNNNNNKKITYLFGEKR